MIPKAYRLVLNACSSSLKFKLFDSSNDDVLLSGLAERIGEQGSNLQIKGLGNDITVNQDLPDHKEAMAALVAQWISLTNDEQLGEKVSLVGHRVVHGGEKFHAPVLVTEEVKQEIERLAVLAPLHNPPNLTGIISAEAVFPKAKQVAVFDTAFHQSMPPHAYRYAVPDELYKEYGIRVYGFHGTSHKYVSNKAISYLELTNKPSKIITLHLGNGCSMAAIKDGKCIDTSMGLSPLAGLIMGTRSGDIDPSLYLLLSQKGFDIAQIDQILNKKSGLVGLAQENDLRELSKRYDAGDQVAILALWMYAYRIKKYIGAYTAALNGLDAIVFTAGVGENSKLMRKLVCDSMNFLGLELDNTLNEKPLNDDISELNFSSSYTKILVVKTNEELEILHEASALLAE
jgi:acetate kinase